MVADGKKSRGFVYITVNIGDEECRLMIMILGGPRSTAIPRLNGLDLSGNDDLQPIHMLYSSLQACYRQSRRNSRAQPPDWPERITMAKIS